MVGATGFEPAASCSQRKSDAHQSIEIHRVEQCCYCNFTANDLTSTKIQRDKITQDATRTRFMYNHPQHTACYSPSHLKEGMLLCIKMGKHCFQ